MKYIFLLDIDGTIVPILEQKIPQSLVSTVVDLQKDEHKFVLATGRSLGSTQKVEGSDVFDYHACLMGLIIYDNKNKEYKQKLNSLDHDALQGLIDYLNKDKLLWFYKDSYDDFTIIDDKEFKEYHNMELVSPDKMNRDLKEKNIYQVFVSGEIDQKIIEKYKDNFEFARVPNGRGGVNYDISAKNVDKSLIVNYFKNNFKDYTIVAIGDSKNDLGMLRTADISVAMANASDEIKAMCDIVTTSRCDNDGVEKFLKEFVKE